MDTKGLVVKSFAAAVFSLFSLQASAATVTFDYTESFGAVPPDGPAPYATATFDDGGGVGSVTLTMSVAPSVNMADVTAMYFNLDPSIVTVVLGRRRPIPTSSLVWTRSRPMVTGSMTSCSTFLRHQGLLAVASMRVKTLSTQ